MRPALVIILAYLIGSIPFGYLIVRMSAGADVRQTGSGGTGATNVSRRAGRLAGVATLLLDALKGLVAVFVAAKWCNQFQVDWRIAEWIIVGAAIAAILGHMFPLWLGFRGGKGVATGAGVFLLLAPDALLAAGVFFLFVVAETMYVSLGSIIAAAIVPLLVWRWGGSVPELTGAVAAALLIIFAHRANIKRLIRGTESKFS